MGTLTEIQTLSPNISGLTNALVAEWEYVDAPKVHNLVESLPRREKAVMAAHCCLWFWSGDDEQSHGYNIRLSAHFVWMSTHFLAYWVSLLVFVFFTLSSSLSEDT